MKNIVDFCIRQHLSLSRSIFQPYNPAPEPKSYIISDEELELEKFYLGKYALHDFKVNSTCNHYLETLYFIDILEKHLPAWQHSISPCEILDVGSKNFSYARALHCFFSQNNRNTRITGIEIDANRMYTNLYTRKDYANYYIKKLSETRYIHGNVLDHKRKYSVITHFLPFVTIVPLFGWGLPVSEFQPEEILNHLYNSLEEGGVMVIINQGEAEAEIQREMIEKTGCKVIHFKKTQSCFLKFRHDRYVWVLEK